MEGISIAVLGEVFIVMKTKFVGINSYLSFYPFVADMCLLNSFSQRVWFLSRWKPLNWLIVLVFKSLMIRNSLFLSWRSYCMPLMS